MQFRGLDVRAMSCIAQYNPFLEDDGISVRFIVSTKEAGDAIVAEFTTEGMIGHPAMTEVLARNMIASLVSFFRSELEAAGLEAAKNGALKGGR
jgi:hypothetical protein